MSRVKGRDRKCFRPLSPVYDRPSDPKSAGKMTISTSEIILNHDALL